MNDYLKVYKATLHTVSPVFVGSGKEIDKKEYRLSFADQKIIVYDPGKLYMALKQLGKSKKYEDMLLYDTKANLNYWMRDNNISPQDIASAIRYSIDWGDRMELGKSKTSIMEFMKDPYGLPYIPGTSIKGMLRTILLSYEISTNKELYHSNSNDIKNYRANRISNSNYGREANSVEKRAFRRLSRDEKHPEDAVNDVLQGMILSDSKPLDLDDLVLCQKIEVHTDYQEKPLNILRECIRPETDIEFTLTIDTQCCNYDVNTIFDAINKFNDMYYSCFQSKYKEEKAPENTVYLGGGVGFVSKTFIYPMFGATEGVKTTMKVMENTMNPKSFALHKHKNDERSGVSPHILKCTRYNGVRYQMGQCRLELKEIH